MSDSRDPKPVPLKLVSMPTQLGDLSAMSAAERAELVEQDAKRRILEEMITAESDALRSFFWAGGFWCGGICASVGSAFLLDGPLSPRYANPWFLVVTLEILAVVGVIAAAIAIYPAIWFGIKWLKAMRRRRGYLNRGTLFVRK
ncbi:hypothetical protein [Haloferula rosea]|uniref:Uncharacterized protein n=1 Tax=Haloferula rosea TaxID=490093 RepID=A0A934R897_9BACT|nr:hypothetical protein [Haloferula rosea]MBK1825730.1 hypothetical protein [Haloferula rosea]